MSFIAVDFGSSWIRAARQGETPCFSQPSLLARDANSLREVALGAQAAELHAGAPGNVQFIRPVRAGRILDWDGAVALLRRALAETQRRRGRPVLLLAAPAQLSLTQKRAWTQLAVEAGAASCQLIPGPLAAALGCGCDLGRPAGRLTLDWGGGSADLGVVAGRQLLQGGVLPWGGLDLDDAVQRQLKQQHGLLVSTFQADEVKRQLLSALRSAEPLRMEIRGFDAVEGLPRTLELTGQGLEVTLHPFLLRLRESLLRLLSNVSPEVCADLVDEGLLLCGGGAQLRELRCFLEQISGLRVIEVQRPDEAVIRGLAEWSSAGDLAPR